MLLCLMVFLCAGAGVLAAAPDETAAPRYVNILRSKEEVDKYSGGFQCKGVCKVANRTTIKITITLKDEYGKKIASKSGNKTGTEYSFITHFNVTPGKKYKVEFAYDAGGERASSTKEITA